MNLLKNILCISILCIFASGCATKTLRVTVPEAQPPEDIRGYVKIEKINDLRAFERSPKVPSAPSIDGDLIDNKNLTDVSVGRMRHGTFHHALWNYTLEDGEDIYGVCSDIVSSSLLSAGYQVVSEGEENFDTAIPLEIDVIKFWAWMQPKFLIDLHFDGELLVRSLDASRNFDVNASTSYMYSAAMAGGGAWTKLVNEGVKELDEDLVIKIKDLSM